MKLSRRKRLFFIVCALLIAAAAATQFYLRSGDEMNLVRLPASTVAIVQSDTPRAEDIEYKEIRAMVREVVEQAGGFAGRIKDNTTVVIKPNLVGPTDYTLPGWRGLPLATEANGVTTDWRVTKALVELVREYNPHGKVYVMEGSGGPDTKTVMELLNYTPEYIPGVDEFLAIEDDSGAWQDFDSPGLVKVALPNGLLHQEYYLNRRYQEADFVISVATLKNHWHAAVTGGIKNVGIGATPANIYGISPTHHGRNNMVDHEATGGDIHQWIHDFFLCRPVDFVLLDGLQGIQNGPTPCYEISRTTEISRDQMNMRLLVAGYDAVAVDAVEAEIVGWDPLAVGYLRLLNRSSAGNLDMARINVVGKRVDQVRKYFAGVIPPAGGRRIEDKTGPAFTVLDWSITGTKLGLSLDVPEDAAKVEIHIDGKLRQTVEEGYGQIDVDLGGAKKPEIRVIAYDRFLNCTVQTLKRAADDLYRAPRARKTPKVDGCGDDACWAAAAWHSIDQLWLGMQPQPDDFNGRFKVVWTPQRLYFLVEIVDDKLSDRHADGLVDYYKDDCLEIFLDEDRSGGEHSYNYNAFAYHIALDGRAVDVGPARAPLYLTKHMTVERSSEGTVHTWEMALDVYDDSYNDTGKSNKTVKLAAGKTLGLALAYCDNDGGSDREHFVGSVYIPGAVGEGRNVAWQDAGVFGGLVLE